MRIPYSHDPRHPSATVQTILAATRQRRMKREAVAELINVSHDVVQRWFRGVRAPRIDQIEKLADKLGLEVIVREKQS